MIAKKILKMTGKSKQEKKPDSGKNPDGKSSPKSKEWLEFYSSNNFGIGIECGKCGKWRLSYQYMENHEVPEEWDCSMWKINDNKYGNCDIPAKHDQSNFQDNKFVPGNLVWAKMGHFPWWPGMIDECPDLTTFFQPRKGYNLYNVTFFNDVLQRRWLKDAQVVAFEEPPKGALNFPKKHQEKLTIAYEKAQDAQSMSIQDRLKKYSFVVLTSNKVKTPRPSKKNLPPSNVPPPSNGIATPAKTDVKIERPNSVDLKREPPKRAAVPSTSGRNAVVASSSGRKRRYTDTTVKYDVAPSETNNMKTTFSSKKLKCAPNTTHKAEKSGKAEKPKVKEEFRKAEKPKVKEDFGKSKKPKVEEVEESVKIIAGRSTSKASSSTSNASSSSLSSEEDEDTICTPPYKNLASEAYYVVSVSKNTKSYKDKHYELYFKDETIAFEDARVKPQKIVRDAPDYGVMPFRDLPHVQSIVREPFNAYGPPTVYRTYPPGEYPPKRYHPSSVTESAKKPKKPFRW